MTTPLESLRRPQPQLPQSRLAPNPISFGGDYDPDDADFLKFAEAYQSRFRINSLTKVELYRLAKVFWGVD